MFLLKNFKSKKIMKLSGKIEKKIDVFWLLFIFTYLYVFKRNNILKVLS